MAKNDCVELVVKASNQQFDDQIIKCKTTWSVLKLKEHLAEVYPCQPTIAEQKLIYHGQLLKDSSVLKNVLRTYDLEPSNHIFHLVYTSKEHYAQHYLNKQSKANNIGADPQHHQQRQPPQQPSTSSSSIYTPANNETTILGSNASMAIPQYHVNGNYVNNSTENLLAHQITLQNWQQVYAQFMAQYMRLLSAGIRPETFFIQNSHVCNNAGQPGPSNIQYFQRNTQFDNLLQENMFNPNLYHGLLNGQQQHQQPPQQQQQQGQVPDDINPGLQQQQQQQPAAGRFPEIVQEEQENRDWLDTFYSFSRLMVLLTLVYFYSSPLRCLAVLFIAIVIYMYHIGYFRNYMDIAEANNNNNNNNNINNNAAAAGEGVGNLPNQQLNNQARNIDDNAGNLVNNPASNDEDSSNLVPEAEQSGISVIGFLRTFVITLFTSLLPETPAL